MQVQGKVKAIFDTKEISASFQKREFVVTTQEQYPQHVIMEFTQDKVSELDGLNPGDEVTVSINLRGREWTSPQGEVRYFNTLQAWRIEKTEAAQPMNELPTQAGSNIDEPPF